jgi:hypothetical protein
MCRCDDVRLSLALTICCEERYGCRKKRTFGGLDVVPELPLVWQCRSKSTPMWVGMNIFCNRSLPRLNVEYCVFPVIDRAGPTRVRRG